MTSRLIELLGLGRCVAIEGSLIVRLEHLRPDDLHRGNAEAGARLDGAGAGAMQKAGGAFPPTIVPIDSAIDRARAAIGDAAETAYAEGKEIALLDAVELGRRLLQAGS